LDEAPGSYKDIDIVMKEQSDLVNVQDELTPLAVMKG
jgi:tRNA-splicing ligase RtcB